MAKICIRGVEHYYEWVRAATGTAPKPVMVFLHGWGGSARYWQTTAQALANEFDCLLYDLRGFGRSRLPVDLSGVGVSDYGMASYARDLAILLDTLGVEQVYLNAHSMGASVATAFLHHYPERVERVILNCSGIFAYNPTTFKVFHWVSRYVVGFRPGWLRHLPYVDRLFMARFLYRSLSQPWNQMFLQDFLMADRAAALGTIYRSVSREAAETLPQEFAALRVPTLLIAGQHDRIIPATMAQQATQLSQMIELALIPNTAHFPMLEDPVAYLAVIQRFLGVSALGSTTKV